MIRFVSLLVLICLTSFVQAGTTGQGAAVHTLVIDPGHGGMDPGAIGPGGHHEADLALAVSLKFGEMVKQAFPEVKIIYTRTTDKFVSLADRADMANKAKADLFICIHLNSATNHDAYGTSTYVLGLHRTDDNLEIAKRENAVIDLEENKDKKYEFDPNSPEGHIIMSMKQNAFLDQSILIASKIEDELAVLSKRKSRGVKQAGFWVLYKTAMPSLLAEIGFISNPTEETYLSSTAGQENIATSIYKAFRLYKFQIEGTKDTASPLPILAKATAPEKKKEQLTIEPSQPSPKVAPVSPSKPQQEPEAQKESTKPQQPSTAAHEQVTPASKEEKAWDPDTTATPPVTVIHKEKEPEPVYQRIDQLANIPPKDTIRQIVTSESMTKKLVPIRTTEVTMKPSTEPDKPVVRREEPKVIKPVKPAVDTVVRKTTAAQVKATATKPKIDSVKAVIVKKETAATVTKKELVPPAKKEVAAPVKKEPVTASKEPATASKKEPAPVKETVAPKKEPAVAKTTPKKSEVTAVAEESANIVFTVQIIAAHKQPKNYDELINAFGLINREDIGDGVVRYMAGQFTHYREAEKTLALAKSKGFPGAFIICYVDNIRQDVKKTSQIGQKHP